MARLGLVEQKAAAIMLNDALKRCADRREDVVHVQMRDDGVVHFEQQLVPIALACELKLCRAGALVVQNVVHGDRHLLGHLLHEADFSAPDRPVFCRLPKPMAPRRRSAVVRGTHNRIALRFPASSPCSLGKSLVLRDVGDGQRAAASSTRARRAIRRRRTPYPA